MVWWLEGGTVLIQPVTLSEAMAYQERLCLKTFSGLPKRPCSLQRENSTGLLGPGIFTWSICNLYYNLSIILAIIALFQR